MHKKGSTPNVANYRPVSVLCNFSKKFQIYFFSRIEDFFKRNFQISCNQFGYKKNKSTELATLNLNFAKNSYANCVFLDYLSWSDTFIRTLLLSKLYKAGIRGRCYNLLHSYFKNGNQAVEFNETLSIRIARELGVVLRSKLGPLFYDLYTSSPRR